MTSCLFVLAGGEAHRAGRDYGPGEAVAVAPRTATTRSRRAGIAVGRHRDRQQPVAGPGAVESDSTTDRTAGNAVGVGLHTAHKQQPSSPPEPQPGRERRQQQHRVGTSNPRRRQTRLAASAQQDTGGQAVVVPGAVQADAVVSGRRSTVPVVDQMQVGPIVAPQLGVHQQQEQRRFVHRQWRRRQTARQQQSISRLVAESPPAAAAAATQVPKGFVRRRSVLDAGQIAKQSRSPARRCVVVVGGGGGRRCQRLQQGLVGGGSSAATAGGRRYQQGTAEQEIQQHV